MEILTRAVGANPGVNMCGTDTIPLMLEMFKDKSVALIGTEEPYLSKAAEVLRKKGNKIVLTSSGFHSVEDYVALIKEIRPEVILLGMGMPKQELLSSVIKAHLTYQCLVINGGAIIDHFGERRSRAPKWMRNTGLEWLFRLMQEPLRLFRRYVIGNFIFLVHVCETIGRSYEAG